MQKKPAVNIGNTYWHGKYIGAWDSVLVVTYPYLLLRLVRLSLLYNCDCDLTL